MLGGEESLLDTDYYLPPPQHRPHTMTREVRFTMLLLSLCNFSVPFGKYLLKKFAKFFSVLARNTVKVVITAATATPKFVGEVAL